VKSNFNMPDPVILILQELNKYGHEAYIVGGCVRDRLLNIEPHDWDICTSANPDEILEIFSGETIIPTGLKHGTVTIMIGSNPYEVTTFRVDGKYTDSRRPDSVCFTDNLTEDLKRRDFTINAMAYNLSSGLIDPFNGEIDLQNNLLKCVGNPNDRFKEDALRILRAMRFAVKYGLDIENTTYEAMVANKDGLKNISKERITSELEKMLSSGNNIKNLFSYCSDIITVIIPELECCIGFDQHNRYHKHTVYEHILSVVDFCDTDEFVIKMAALLHDIGKPSTYTEDEEGHGHFYGHPEASYEISKEILSKRLRLSNDQYNEILLLVKYHDMDLATTRRSVKRALNKLGESTLKKWAILKFADRKDHVGFLEEKVRGNLNRIEEILDIIIATHDCFTIKDLSVNGGDLISIGYTPGKELGDILKHLLQLVIDGCENDKDMLLGIAASLKVKEAVK
jgi:tRNA nucleotidyltransferase (CCA-adding enzyme)